MDNVLLTIPMPKETFFQDNVKKAKETKKWIKKQWKLCDNDEIDCDEVHEAVKTREDETSSLLSVLSLVPVIELSVPRPDGMSFDVTKIVISNKNYDMFKKYDFEILKAVFGDIMSVKRLNSQLGMFHLCSGFATSDEASDEFIYILNDAIKKEDRY